MDYIHCPYILNNNGPLRVVQKDITITNMVVTKLTLTSIIDSATRYRCGLGSADAQEK